MIDDHGGRISLIVARRSQIQIADLRVEGQLYNQQNNPRRNLKMDISDYDNTYKYKFFLPILYVVNWALMLTGPFFYPAAYQIYCFGVVIIMGLKGLQSFLWGLKALFNGVKFLKQAKKLSEQKKLPTSSENDLDENDLLSENIEPIGPIRKEMFAFIIPSYKEDPELLGQTLMHLAIHSEAKKRYMIFLAMEAHEEGSIEKAEKLIAAYSKYFKLMSFSHHSVREYEQKGKASNVSWCAENLEEKQFKKHGIDPNDVYVTVMDADSWAPEIYFVEIQNLIEKDHDLRYKTIFEPSQMFTRNNFEVPLATRVYDQNHSGIHFVNLVSVCGISFPLSNYTLSFNLIKKVGFWDTCPDAIGEDFHTTIKAFWKTEGEIKTVCVHTPFNQVNVQTGNGYYEDVMARFWQAERHARGCADVAYVLKMLFTRPFNIRTTLISYHVLECFLLPAFIPWAIVGYNILKITSSFMGPADLLIDDFWFDNIISNSTNAMVLNGIAFFLYIRYAQKILYGQTPDPLWRVIEYPLFWLLPIFTMTVPTFVIAAFKVMLNKNEYNCAEKKISNSSKLIQNVEELPAIKL